MNENFIKVTWETGKNGNPPTGFGVMAQGGVRGSMMAAAIVERMRCERDGKTGGPREGESPTCWA